jgi:CRP/FNR family cyclic AMP-dependent transcriptional regulator
MNVATILSFSTDERGETSRPPQTRRPSLAEFLSSTAWFQMLAPLAQERVLADSFERTHETRSVVVPRGEMARSWIGVIEGLVKADTQNVSGRTVMFCAFPQGAWLSEGSVIKKEQRRYELMALRPTAVAHVPRPTFMWLLETSTDFSRFIIDHLNERAGQFIGAMELLRIELPVARVAAAICNLFNAVLYPNAGPLLNISQEEIGELAGLSRTTTNMALKRLQQLGLVRIEYGALLVMNVEALRDFSQSAASQ